MARIRKEYKMTEKNVEYIEEVKEKNNLKKHLIFKSFFDIIHQCELLLTQFYRRSWRLKHGQH